MLKNNRIALVLVLMLSSFSAGCSVVDDGDLLVAPRTAMKYGEVTKLVSSNTNGEYRLVAPSSGKNGSPIQFVDLDGDGDDEIIEFYRLVAEKYTVRALIFRKSYGTKDISWDVDKAIQGFGDGLYKVEFGDMNADGKLEIAVNWDSASRDRRPVSLYSYSYDGTTGIFDDICAQIGITDMDSDGRDDLVVVKGDKNRDLSHVQMYSFRGKYVSQVASCRLDTNASGYFFSTAGKAIEGVNGFFLDASLGESSSYTELVVYRNSRLERAISDSASLSERKGVFKVEDVNHDGIIDIPAAGLSENATSENAMGYGSRLRWCDWDGKNGLSDI